MSPRTTALAPYLLLAALSLFWGLNWPGIKIIVSEVSVWWFRALCLIGGGSILMILSYLSGNRCRLQRGELGSILLCGSFAILGWMVFSAYGVSLMPAGRASIVAFTMPLWATLAAAYVLGERITLAKVVGLLLGLAGLGTLIGPDLLILQRAPIGALFMLLAAISWAIGTVLVKHIDWKLPTLSNIAWQLLMSAIPVTAIAFVIEPFPDLTAPQPQGNDCVCLHHHLSDEFLPMGLLQDGWPATRFDRRHRHADGAGRRRLLQSSAARRTGRRLRHHRPVAGALGTGDGVIDPGLATLKENKKRRRQLKNPRTLQQHPVYLGQPRGRI